MTLPKSEGVIVGLTLVALIGLAMAAGGAWIPLLVPSAPWSVWILVPVGLFVGAVALMGGMWITETKCRVEDLGVKLATANLERRSINDRGMRNGVVPLSAVEIVEVVQQARKDWIQTGDNPDKWEDSAPFAAYVGGQVQKKLLGPR